MSVRSDRERGKGADWRILRISLASSVSLDLSKEAISVSRSFSRASASELSKVQLGEGVDGLGCEKSEG